MDFNFNGNTTLTLIKNEEKETFAKKVNESKFYGTFFVTFFLSFPMIPLIPLVIASDPATELW